MEPPQYTGSARGFGSTTTRRCWRQCAGRAVCAAFTSSILGSRPPRQWGSTDGGEGARDGVAAGLGDATWPLGRPARSLSLTPKHEDVLSPSSHVRKEDPGLREVGYGDGARSPEERSQGQGSS